MSLSLLSLIQNSIVDGRLVDDFILPYNDDLNIPDGMQEFLMTINREDESLAVIDDDSLKYIFDGIYKENFNVASQKIEETFKKYSIYKNREALIQFLIDHEEEYKAYTMYAFVYYIVNNTSSIDVMKFALLILRILPISNPMKSTLYQIALCGEFTFYVTTIVETNDAFDKDVDFVYTLFLHTKDVAYLYALSALSTTSDEIAYDLRLAGLKKSVFPPFTSWRLYDQADVVNRLKDPTPMEKNELAGTIKIISTNMQHNYADVKDDVNDIANNLYAHIRKIEPLTYVGYSSLLNLMYVMHANGHIEQEGILRNALCSIQALAFIQNEFLENKRGFELCRQINFPIEEYGLEFLRDNFEENMQEGYLLLDDEETRDEVLNIYIEKLPLEQMRKENLSVKESSHLHPYFDAVRNMLSALSIHTGFGEQFISQVFSIPDDSIKQFVLQCLNYWVNDSLVPLHESNPGLYSMVAYFDTVNEDLELEDLILPLLNKGGDIS